MVEAVSRGYHDQDKKEVFDFSPMAAFCANLTKIVLEHGLPANTFINVNIPGVHWYEVKGVELTRLGRRVYRDELVRRKDPRGRPYYWIGGLPPKGVADHGTDIWAMENKLVSVTPINLDLTDHHMIEDLKRWKLEEITL